MKAETKTGGRAATLGIIPGRYALSVGNPNTPLPEGWRWVRLSDVARLETGHTPSRRKPEYWGGDVPWVGIRDATANHGKTIYDTTQHTNKLGLDNSSARLLPANTVCLSRTASVGYVVVMGRPMATSQDFVNWVCSDHLNHDFLRYVLLVENDSMLRFASGTTHQTIYFPEAKAFHVAMPERREQDRIAHILGTLDDKIELNRRMNETLEAMARALFKSWFVDFDPVRVKAEAKASGNPGLADEALAKLAVPPDLAPLFPDAFEESALGMVPKGWEVGSIADIARYVNGRNFTKGASGTGRMVIRIAELNSGPGGSTVYNDVEADPDNTAYPDDVLFAWSGSLNVYRWHRDEAIVNQHIFKVVCEEYPKWFVYQHLVEAMPFFQGIASHKATTMGHIKRGHLTEATLVLPPKALLEKVSHLVQPDFELVHRNARQSATLEILRDALLPKLLSGEVRVDTSQEPEECPGN